MLGVSATGPLEGDRGADGATDRGAADRDAEREADRVAERDAWTILVGVDGLGPVGFATLLERFGSGRAILRVATEPGGVRRLAATAPSIRVGR